MPEKIRQAVINNGGGHLNHCMFWMMMAPKDKGGEPKGDLAKAIDGPFGSLAKFQDKFTDAGDEALRQRLGVAGAGQGRQAADVSAPPTRTAPF